MKKSIIPIELSARAIEHKGSDYYYISHVFNALREHPDLMEQPDYKRLYGEAIDYIFRSAVERGDWEANERESFYAFIELLSDITNSKPSIHIKKYSIETVNLFLEKRKQIWEITDPLIPSIKE